MGGLDLEKPSGKRTGYLEWQDYFMAIAFLSAQRSKDPRTQVGACIVNKDKKIVGIGYNGMPIGCSDDVMPWKRAGDASREEWLDSKAPYVCHAELNAVLNKNLVDIKGCSIYVALFPCNACAQIIIQSGISEVVYYSDKYHSRKEFEASRRLFKTAGVTCRQHKPERKQILIDFDSIEESEESTVLPVIETPNSSSTMISASINNNNIGSKKDLTIENHAEQQQLQMADEMQVQDSLLQSAAVKNAWSNNMVEVYFSIISLLAIGLLVFLTWYFSSAQVIVSID